MKLHAYGKVEYLFMHYIKPHILSNSLSHLPHRYLCYLLGPVMPSFPVAEKTSNIPFNIIYCMSI